MQPQQKQIESEYDQITIKNIFEDEDFTFQMGYDSSNNPITFTIPAGETITFSRYLAQHAIRKMIETAIRKFEWYEVDRRGKIVKQYGGHLTLDPAIQQKYREMILQEVKPVASSAPKSVAEQFRDQFNSIIGRKGSDDAFASLNSGDEVSKMSFPKLKKVANALGIDTNVKGMTQEKLRDEVRRAMAAEGEE